MPGGMKRLDNHPVRPDMKMENWSDWYIDSRTPCYKKMPNKWKREMPVNIAGCWLGFGKFHYWHFSLPFFCHFVIRGLKIKQMILKNSQFQFSHQSFSSKTMLCAPGKTCKTYQKKNSDGLWWRSKERLFGKKVRIYNQTYPNNTLVSFKQHFGWLSKNISISSHFADLCVTLWNEEWMSTFGYD